MLKGHVFSKQLFENHIFALFINTFLNGENGVSDNYLNGMEVTYSGSSVTISSGAVCIQGRFIEEDSSTTLNAGTSNLYNKLVVEVDLDKQNTETALNQVSYKIVTNSSNYPNLTQTDVVKNNAGIYQYELARFKTGTSGITDFQDMRTFLNFESIYQKMQAEYRGVLGQLEEELANVEDGSAYFLKNNIAEIYGEITAIAGINDGIARATKTINYPENFNSTNCVLISVGIKVKNDTTWMFGDIGDCNLNKSADNVFEKEECYEKSVSLTASNIVLKVRNSSYGDDSQASFKDDLEFKIILMKI